MHGTLHRDYALSRRKVILLTYATYDAVLANQPPSRSARHQSPASHRSSPTVMIPYRLPEVGALLAS
jgi:hypothetical protein